MGEVTVTDLVTGQTKLLAARSDWEGMDPIVWTPWGTLLVGEETNAQQRPDPDFPNAVGGLMYEIFLHQGDPTVADSVVARPALGAKAHEGTRFDSQGNLYGISERNPGYIFKFVPDERGDLSSGQAYALIDTNGTYNPVSPAYGTNTVSFVGNLLLGPRPESPGSWPSSKGPSPS